MTLLRNTLVILLLTSLLVAPAAGAMTAKPCCCESLQSAAGLSKSSAASCCASGPHKTSAAPQGCCSSSGLTLGCRPELAEDCCFFCGDCEPAPSTQSRPVSVDNPLEILYFLATSATWDEPVQIAPETSFDHSLPADPGPPIRVRYAVWLI